jgi:CRP-like cAMP-binding protein
MALAPESQKALPPQTERLMHQSMSLTDVFLRKLDSIHTLDEDDRNAVNRLPLQIAELRADQDILREGDRTMRCCFLLTGLACWYKTTGAGKRQILSFLVPGDLPDLQSLHLSTLDSTLMTLSPCRVAFVQHEPLRDLCERRPNVASAFWRMTLIDAAIYREWVANIGSRQAYGRVSHLLCELVVRLCAVGLGDNHICDLPITQTELAGATGLSTVHVNRTLQTLRREKLIRWTDSKLEVLDWQRLREAGDFSATYLHLRKSSSQYVPDNE